MSKELVFALAALKKANTANERIDNLPLPMVFKGTLGTGGTIESLPTASSANEGFVYIVITDGTYASQSAKAGDTFVSDGSSWVLVPSGDDAGSGGTKITQTLTAGSTTLTFSNVAIQTTSFVSVFAPVWYSDMVQSAGSVVLTFPEQSADIVVGILVV